MGTPDRVWQRAREQTITATLGRLPEPPADLRPIRVSCEVAPAALRPLLEARRLTEAILGESRPRPERSKLRARTLFGDTPERATEAVVVELWNHLAQKTSARWVVVFDAVEQADAATLAALLRIVRRPGWVLLPMVLVFHAEPVGAAAELVAAVRERNPEGVLRGEAPAAAAEAPAIAWSSLPPKVLRVLRAGALIGPGFELRIVAELLTMEPLDVLERIQQAIDLGVPVEDRGEGRFSLPAAALSALSASIMPSLAQAWHRQLGRLLGARAVKDAVPPPPPPGAARPRANLPTDRAGDARFAAVIDLSHEADDLIEETNETATDTTGAQAGAGPEGHVSSTTSATDPDGGATTGGPPEHVRTDMSGGPPDGGATVVVPPEHVRTDMSGSPEGHVPSSTPPPAPRRPVQRRTVLSPPTQGARAGKRRTLYLAPDVDMPAPVTVTPTTTIAAPEPGDPLIDRVRAAEHMRLAGDPEAAAEHLCGAARAAAESGAPQTAVQHAGAALELLATLPVGASRRRLRARALLELGRVQWQAPGFEHGFTLANARATLEAARAELDPDAPVELTVDLAQALAGVHFDLGDPPALARALAELEEASRALQATNDAIGAAGLFNDQAAVRVRMGDAAHALKLLRASRAIFEARAQDDPAALREVAESAHLFALLPLHSRMRVGREDEGYAIAMDHALAAEQMFRELDDERELARVWETMGRIELRRLRLDEARQRLEAAFTTQTKLGDLTGLAQTTEFLSEVLAWFGRNVEAIAMLRDSVVYNRDKGSPRGLASNRQAFDNLSSRFASLPQHADGLREVEVLLAAGERELGAPPQ